MSRVLLVALLVLTAVTGCATIPERTPPKVVTDNPVDQPNQIRKPTPGVDPYTLVQEFMRAGGPEAARTYLTEEARQTWPLDPQPVIISDRPTTRPHSVQASPPDGGVNTQTLQLLAEQIGRLDSDQSFQPAVQQIEDRIVVQRQPDGQWRISTPPSYLITTESTFRSTYRQVNLRFFDPERRVMVPDPRYVLAEPREDLEGRVMYLLLAGPSTALRDAVRTELAGVELRTNVVRESDGAVLVNLTKVERPPLDREHMAAQIVNSLHEVTTSPLRLLFDGRPLVPDQQDWYPSDVGTYDAPATLGPDLLGLVVKDRRLISLRDGKPTDGPAGTGAYDIAGAAQSLDGSQLALVERTSTGMQLRIGRIGEDLPVVPLPRGTALTRPTWTPGDGDNAGNEVWTVVDGTLVVRLVRTAEGGWRGLAVDSTELVRAPQSITQLRLSRDGVRLAAVVDGEVKVATIVRTNDTVAIRPPRTLQGGAVRDVVGLDWLDRVTLVVATRQSTMPVAALPIDGLTYTQYNSTNLTLPVTAVAAAPSRPVVVTDGAGMWSTQEPGKVWQLHQFGQGPQSLPFYPG